MGDFLLSSFSLMALIIMLTGALFAVSLKTSTENADYKNWLLFYFVGLLLEHSMGFLSGGLHSDIREQTYRYTNTLFNVGYAITAVSYIQVAYLFPQKAFERERKWLLYITTGYSVIYLGALIWFHFIQDQQGLSSRTYGKFINPLAGLFGGITTVWAVIVYLRKAHYYRRHRSKYLAPARLLAICTLFLLIISGLFIYPGGQHEWVMIVYTYGLWIVIQAEVLIFIIYSAFPISFRPKLVGFVFASVMAILSVAVMTLVPFTTNAEDPANIAQRVADQATLVRLMKIILGSAVFLLLVYPLILRESVIKPLQRLMLGIERAEKGDLSVEVPFGVLDEIGIVTRNFNGMVQSLKQSKDELTRHAATLESQVTERTAELSKSLQDLQTTQQQLIQSEKLASLGELTAGIAHEIQNPLNFVNNFSEVNSELIDEMHEQLALGNRQQAIEIANSIRENQEKINHHGKRADAIVKGMLEHSRTSSGQKVPTDINALADEYLRLAYHGMRAKDKSFNAKITTDFDNGIGKVNIVTQDIGRVMLNLINNAFYAVHEKQNNASAGLPTGQAGSAMRGYEPTVAVSSKKNQWSNSN
jgi:signal transduction histidine kinase